MSFKVGDEVMLKNQDCYNSAWKGKMIITDISNNLLHVCAEHPIRGEGAFSSEELEPYKGVQYYIVADNETVYTGSTTFHSEDEALKYINENPDDYSEDEEVQIVKVVRTLVKKLPGFQKKMRKTTRTEVVYEEVEEFHFTRKELQSIVNVLMELQCRRLRESGCENDIVEKSMKKFADDLREYYKLDTYQCGISWGVLR